MLSVFRWDWVSWVKVFGLAWGIGLAFCVIW